MGKLKYKLKNVDEISTTGGGTGAAGFTPGTGAQYATPLAFNKNKKAKGAANPNVVKSSGYKVVKEEDPGATLGPGPRATEKGVTNNYYVKKFKYKLVPDKIKGSGLEVKQLFEDDTAQSQFQKERIIAFDSIRQEMNNIYKLLSNAKNKTIDYYRQNPLSYGVVYPTDLVFDYIKDIKNILTGEEWKLKHYKNNIT